jgi:hypothetical protein
MPSARFVLFIILAAVAAGLVWALLAPVGNVFRAAFRWAWTKYVGLSNRLRKNIEMGKR